MPVTVTWASQRGSQRNSNGERLTVERFQVTGVDSKEEAELADSGTRRVPRLNEAHPNRPELRARDVDVSGGPVLWNVDVTYARARAIPFGSGERPAEQRPFRVRAISTVEVIDVDRTADDKPILSPVGQPYDPPLRGEMRYDAYQITGTFATPAEALAYRARYNRRVNADDWSFSPSGGGGVGGGGVINVPAGSARVLSVEIDEFEVGTTGPVAATVTVEVRPGAFPYAERRQPTSLEAWTSVSAGLIVGVYRARIHSKLDKRPITEPIPLDALGRIPTALRGSYGVGPTLADSIAAPGEFSPHFGALPSASGVGDILYYKTYEETSFADLIPVRSA